MGSTGNGRPTRIRTASVTDTMSQRRANTCSARTAATSWAGVRRPSTRARMMARVASANVSAEVTRRPNERSDDFAAASCSSSAATSALDSTYQIVARSAAAGTRFVRPTPRTPRTRAGLALRFATVAIDQICRGARRETNIRPLLQRIARFDCGPNDASRYQLFVATAIRPRRPGRRYEFRDDATVCRHGDTFSRLDPPDIATQVVFQLADARRGHIQLWPHMATTTNVARGQAAPHSGQTGWGKTQGLGVGDWGLELANP
jgi:hypothetical protein